MWVLTIMIFSIGSYGGPCAVTTQEFESLRSAEEAGESATKVFMGAQKDWNGSSVMVYSCSPK